MALLKISVHKSRMKFDKTYIIKEIAKDKGKMYAVNAVKAAKELLEERKRKKK